ncbi:hypothetical protein [Pelagibius sp.]|uniref:hypothetical protein n=1 Tax=Pelagibius sp. TaxID=1931238 RepID=UPI003BAFA1A4
MTQLIEVQDTLIETLNKSASRWNVNSHLRYRHCDSRGRRICGHYPRTRRGAVKRARKALALMGFDNGQQDIVIKDAIDMAELHLRCGE